MKKRTKTISFIILQVVLALITLELSPFLLYPVFYRHAFSPSKIRHELTTPPEQLGVPYIPEDTSDHEFSTNVLHPYLGFTSVPVNDYNRFGFLGDDPLQHRGQGIVNICITGGSVAKGMYLTAGNYLIDRIRGYKPWKDKKITVTLLALGGFKQPQQLLALNYFLSLGAEYDVVINLDGFNDIVLPFTDNLPLGVNPSYPRHWSLYARKGLDLGAQLIIGREASARQDREDYRRFFSRTPLRYSNLMLLTWTVLDGRKGFEIIRCEKKLREALSELGAGFQATGPFTPVHDTDQFFTDQAALWGRASLQMAKLCESMDMAYLHFLQPNQYVNGSKVFTIAERAIAVEEGSFDYKDAVKKGYPFLIRQGEHLARNGVDFNDLTGIFRQEARTVYNDKCCHLNELGYQLICDRIAEQVIRHQEKRRTGNK